MKGSIQSRSRFQHWHEVQNSQGVVEFVVLELEVLARHSGLVAVVNDGHIVAVLYHQDLAKHPSVRVTKIGTTGSLQIW